MAFVGVLARVDQGVFELVVLFREAPAAARPDIEADLGDCVRDYDGPAN